jgi:hypothetical protein
MSSSTNIYTSSDSVKITKFNEKMIGTGYKGDFEWAGFDPSDNSLFYGDGQQPTAKLHCSLGDCENLKKLGRWHSAWLSRANAIDQSSVPYRKPELLITNAELQKFFIANLEVRRMR